MDRYARILLVWSIAFGLAFPGGRALADEPKKEPAKKESKEKEEQKDDERKLVDPEFIQQLTLSLSTMVGALIALQTVRPSFRNSFAAIAELRNFSEHRATYLRLQEEVAKMRANQPGRIAELERAFGRYAPALRDFDGHIRGVIGEEEPTLEERTARIEGDLQKLVDMPGAARWKEQLGEALKAWQEGKRPYPIEHWIGTHLKSKFLSEGPGRAWLLEYTQHRKELAAAHWAATGSTLLLDEWVEHNANREMIFTEKEKKWQTKYRKLRGDEEKAAKIFVREFATFTRNLNKDLADPENKFSELLMWANREPGVFHTSDSGKPVPIAATSMLDYASGRCASGMRALKDALGRARETGSYVMMPVQGLRAVSPAITGGATLVTAYMSVRGFTLLWDKYLNGNKSKDNPPKGKDKGEESE